MKTDTQYLEAYVDRGERGAFDALVARHYGHIYQVALHLVHDEFDARDVAQSVFVQALRHAGQVRDRTRFRAWLLRITVNEVRQRWRKRNPPTPVDQLQLAFEEARGPSAEKEASRREFEFELERALESMPGRLKVPLVLHYYQSLSLAEVAAILELPKSTVQHRVEKAIRLLRKRFGRRNPTVLLPMISAHFPASPTATAGAAAALSAGGVLSMKAYLFVGAALLLALLAATGLLGSFGAPGTMARDEGDVPTAEGGDGGERAASASLRGRTESTQPVAVPLAVAPDRAVHSRGTGRIVGRVLALENGRGVPRVRITLSLSAATDDDLGIKPFKNRYVSGPRGAFVCDQLPRDGAYTLVFHHPEYAYAQLVSIAMPRAHTEADVGAVLLDRAVTLEGVVVDPAGAPVAGATISAGDITRRPLPVTFRYREGKLEGARTTSGPDGRFRLMSLAAGYHRLLVTKPGYASLGLAGVRAVRGAQAPLRVTIRPSRPIEGVVVDGEGRPIIDAAVEIGLLELIHTGTQGYVRFPTWTTLRTADGGRFHIDDFPEATGVGFTIDVSHSDYPAFHESYYTRPSGVLRITLQRPPQHGGVPVVVRVLDEYGRALRGVPGTVQLSLDSDEFVLVTTLPVDEQAGEVTFEEVPPGEHYLSVEVLGYRPRGEPLAVGDAARTAPFALERGAVAEGRVVDAATGEPVPGAVVSTSDVNRVATDAAGRFRLRGLTGGVRVIGAVTVTAEGYLEASPQLPFEKDEDHVELEVPLWAVPELRTVVGEVVDVEGRPVAGASLDLELASPSVYRVPARTDAGGRFTFRAVDPTHLRKRMRIRIAHPTYARSDAWVVAADLDRPLRLTLESGRRVSGRVVDEAGLPVADVTVGAVATERFGRLESAASSGNLQDVDSLAGAFGPTLAATARTDAEGRFMLEHAPTRALQVLASGPDTRWLVEDGRTGVHVIEGRRGVESLVLQVLRAWTVRGRVEDSEGRPLAGMEVVAARYRQRTITASDGSFTLPRLFGDSVALEVDGGGHAARVEVTPGTADGLLVVATP